MWPVSKEITAVGLTKFLECLHAYMQSSLKFMLEDLHGLNVKKLHGIMRVTNEGYCLALFEVFHVFFLSYLFVCFWIFSKALFRNLI